MELKGITATRMVIPTEGNAYFNVNNTPEYCIMQLLQTQLTAPTDVKRQILASVAAYNDSTNLHKDSYRYSNLKDEILTIAVGYNIGWYADIEDGEIVFHIVHGEDRTATQSINSRIVLSYANDSILQSSFTHTGNLPETAYVAGQGEGASRDIYIVNTEGALNGVQNDVNALNQFKQTQETLIYADAEGVHVGESGSNVGVLLAPDKLSLTDNTGNESAYMSNSNMYIKHAQIINTMQIGGVQFAKYDSGRIALKWVG